MLHDKIIKAPDIWEIFTKKEEYEPPFLDQYERFPYYLSKHRDVTIPKVSRYLVDNGFKPEYPDNKEFAVCLTHDIDIINEPFLDCMFGSVKSFIKGDFKNVVKYPYYAINKRKHPYYNFHKIMQLEKKYGATSSFYFLALEKGEQDYSYDLEDLKEDIRTMDENGWEVGLHGGHKSYNNYEDLIEKKKKLESVLGKNIVGYRNHFLRFKVPDTWELLSKAGFKYDTTFGYNDCAGFRNGMCHPFRPVNLKTEELIDILEIPLTIMDCTLLKDYMRLDFKNAWDLTKMLIDTVAECHGVITILWHNTFMQDRNWDFYENILKYCYEKDAWMTNGRDICEWWVGNDKY